MSYRLIEVFVGASKNPMYLLDLHHLIDQKVILLSPTASADQLVGRLVPLADLLQSRPSEIIVKSKDVVHLIIS